MAMIKVRIVVLRCFAQLSRADRYTSENNSDLTFWKQRERRSLWLPTSGKTQFLGSRGRLGVWHTQLSPKTSECFFELGFFIQT
jgi:hypothetical protein